jgi:molecular chaperone DnaJ
MKGQNIQEIMEIPLIEALFGVEKGCSFAVVSSCEGCGGAGATEFDVCPACRGAGGVTQRQENMVFHQTCGACGGQGRVPKAPCSQCSGRGTTGQNKEFTVIVPEGIAHGAMLRLAGQGGRGFHGGPPGDALIQLKVSYPDLKALSEKEQAQLRKLLAK